MPISATIQCPRCDNNIDVRVELVVKDGRNDHDGCIILDVAAGPIHVPAHVCAD